MRALGVQTPLPGTRGGMNMGIYADGTAAGRKLYYGGIKIRKMALGNRKVYSSGNICTYHVEEGTTYMEEVDEGASCLSPQSFTPEKEGWEFAGWRQDAAAEGEVLGSLVMGDDPVELYAVFRQEVTLSYHADGATGENVADEECAYYNNGSLVEASFIVKPNMFTKAGYTFRSWFNTATNEAVAPGTEVTSINNLVFKPVWLANTTGNVLNDPDYITIQNTWGTSKWYSMGTDGPKTGHIYINYGPYKKATINCGVAFTNTDAFWQATRTAQAWVNGTLIADSARESGNHFYNSDPYIFATTATTITVQTKCTNNDHGQTWVGSNVIINSIILSL